MQCARIVVVLAFGASHAFAQPAPNDPPTPADPPPVTEPTPAESPTPEVGKDQVREPTPAPTPPEVPSTVVDTGTGTCDQLDCDNLLHNERASDRGFRFGSYGRVLAGSDLRGGKPERVRVTAVTPRIIEPSYLELEFSYGFERKVSGGLLADPSHHNRVTPRFAVEPQR